MNIKHVPLLSLLHDCSYCLLEEGCWILAHSMHAVSDLNPNLLVTNHKNGTISLHHRQCQPRETMPKHMNRYKKTLQKTQESQTWNGPKNTVLLFIYVYSMYQYLNGVSPTTTTTTTTTTVGLHQFLRIVEVHGFEEGGSSIAKDDAKDKPKQRFFSWAMFQVFFSHVSAEKNGKQFEQLRKMENPRCWKLHFYCIYQTYSKTNYLNL